MCPLTCINHTYQTVFVSEWPPLTPLTRSSQPPSRFSLSIKESLLSVAADLGVSTKPSSADHSSSSRRRASTLDATLQEEVDHIVVSSREKDALHALREKEAEQTKTFSDTYCLNHVVLGSRALDPIVLVNPSSLPDKESFPSLPVTSSLVCTRSYERALAKLSKGKEKTQSVPLCLACCTQMLRYPWRRVERDLTSVTIASRRR